MDKVYWRNMVLRALTITIAFLVPTQALAVRFTDPEFLELKTTILSLINGSRAEERLPALQYSEAIQRVAQRHADDTADHFDPSTVETREASYLAHVSSDGRALGARFRDVNADAGWAYAENVGYWTRNPFGDLPDASRFGLRLIHEGMMAEVPPNDAHRTNIVGDFTHIGIGLSLLHGETDGENVLFFVSNFVRYTTEEEERTLRTRGSQSPSGGARSLFGATPPSHGGPFADVRPADKFAGAIAAMKEGGVFDGYGDGTFQSLRTVNRAEFLKAIFVLLDLSPIGREFNACFSDVFNQWFAPYICLAKREGWARGFPDGTFRPEQAVTRAEGVTLASRILQPTITVQNTALFDDVTQDSWFFHPLQAMAGNGLLPFEGRTFHPQRGMTRGEVAEMLFRASKD